MSRHDCWYWAVAVSVVIVTSFPLSMACREIFGGPPGSIIASAAGGVLVGFFIAVPLGRKVADHMEGEL